MKLDFCSEPRSHHRASIAARSFTGLIVLFGISYACSSNGTLDDDVVDPDVALALGSIAQCTVELNETFVAAAAELKGAVLLWSENVQNVELQTDAQDSWKRAMGVWQQLELTQFGPAARSSQQSVGAQDLRDEIYSWPVVNACAVDQGLVKEIWKGDLKSELIKARGMDALEYLLFASGSSSACSDVVNIISDGSWSSLTNLPQRRAGYALEVARDIEKKAQTLESAWAPAQGDFQSDFRDAPQSKVYSSQAEALDAAFAGLMYLDVVTKDEKLGALLAATGEPEQGYSSSSKASVAKNIDAFDKFLDGCGGENLGLDALLRKKGNGALADDLRAALDAIRVSLEAIEGESLGAALPGNRDQVQALYDTVKVLTDLLKGELVATLNVRLNSVQGEND